MKNQKIKITPFASGWINLDRLGGIAAILSGLLFRRNLGVEIALFSPVKVPAAVGDWFTLLETQRFLGLVYLGIFDIVNYLLVGFMLLALSKVLWRFASEIVIIGLWLGFLGIAIYMSSNVALSLLSLSNQYAIAISEDHKRLLLSAGQTLLSLNPFSSPGGSPGAGGYLSLLLVAAAGFIFSITILRDKVFGPFTAYIGLAANGLDLMYCIAFLFVPATSTGRIGLLFIPAAGLFLMIWHIVLGWGFQKHWQQIPK
ncbi:MAG: hypothetical protein RBT01_03275 [Anaerolineaceae bacterium]|jgi:hypothetical protein|nr:hypothetical protein [Anaerolineaceae bacterium]